jgi:acyl-coenzyme A synthetase/AMP-(fatty) acid ligase
VLSGEGEEQALLKAVQSVTNARPRGQQLTGVIFIQEPLPRTATGKIKRWELQQKVGLT